MDEQSYEEIDTIYNRLLPSIYSLQRCRFEDIAQHTQWKQFKIQIWAAESNYNCYRLIRVINFIGNIGCQHYMIQRSLSRVE